MGIHAVEQCLLLCYGVINTRTNLSGLGLDVDWDCQSYSWDKTVENHQSYQHGIVGSKFSKGFQEIVQS